MENEMDVVYILGDGSRWYNNEIRYSLRSLQANFKYRNVYIIGECPSWIHGVIHIPVKDSKSNAEGVKLYNARHKYSTACNEPGISENFVLMNDDFFFLKEVEEIKNYSRGKLGDMMEKHPTKNGYYYKSLADTRNRIRRFGVKDPIDFEVHAPIIFNKEKLAQTIDKIGNDRAYSFRSCYGNMWKIEPEMVMDFKAASLPEFIYQTNKDREFLSTNDSLVSIQEFRLWIQRKFPKPSKYEKDLGKGSGELPGRPMGEQKYYATRRFTYNRKTFSDGDLVDHETIQLLKRVPEMRGVWILK
jgi:hypothetical protein